MKFYASTANQVTQTAMNSKTYFILLLHAVECQACANKLNSALLDLVNFIAVDCKIRNIPLNPIVNLLRHRKERDVKGSKNAVTADVALKKPNKQISSGKEFYQSKMDLKQNKIENDFNLSDALQKFQNSKEGANKFSKECVDANKN